MRKKVIVVIVFSCIALLSLVILFFYQNSIYLFNNKNNVNVQNLEAMGISEKSLSYEAKQNVKIAIIDSGINKHHPDLDIPLGNAVNFIQEGSTVYDEFNHGTAIAGIIAAKNNDVGIVGVANKAEIFDLKVLDDEGKGEIRNLIKAIEWCIENQIDIINISFGFQTSDDKLLNVIEKAHENNIIIVAAAGNTYGIGVDYPARYENVISVNSLNEDKNPLNSSAYGKIDVAAPGFEILSTDSNGKYSKFSGTSFSTAYVTGIIANLMSRNLISKEDIKTELKEYTQDIHEPNFDNYTGNGIIKLEVK